MVRFAFRTLNVLLLPLILGQYIFVNYIRHVSVFMSRKRINIIIYADD